MDPDTRVVDIFSITSRNSHKYNSISLDWLSLADCFQFLHELPDCVCLHVSLLVVYGIRRAPSLIVTTACHNLPQAACFSVQTTVVCDWCVISSQTRLTAGAGGFLSATFKFLSFALGLITFPFRRACCSLCLAFMFPSLCVTLSCRENY